MFTIYALTDPETNLIRYVGRAKDPKRRLQYHRRPATGSLRTYRQKWIHSLQQRGLQPAIVVCDTCDDEATANELECAWIKLFRMAGVPLTNLTDGGEGTCGRVHTAEAREKMRQHRRGKGGRPGYKHTPEAKEKMSQARLGRKPSPETQEKLRQVRTGRKHSPETRNKMGQSLLGNKRWLGHKHTPETKEKIRISSLAAWIRRKAKA